MRKISQETFDEVVQENIEDFDMTTGDALIEAVNQFRIQEVDLSDIDVTGGVGMTEFVNHITALEDYLREENYLTVSVDSIVTAIVALNKLCSKSNDINSNKIAMRNQNMMSTKGGLTALRELMKVNNNQTGVYSILNKKEIPYPLDTRIQIESIKCMHALCKSNVANRDFFEPGGSELLVDVIRYYHTKVVQHICGAPDSSHAIHVNILCCCFKLCRVVGKTELNKCKFVGGYLILLLK